MNRDHLRERLNWYGPVEMLNAALVPGLMIGWCLIEQQAIGWLLPLACVPMCALLLIGGLYWRAKRKQLDGDTSALASILALADRFQMAMLVLCGVAVIASVASWLVAGMGLSFGEKLAATIAATLAMLEYVNYYHRQLQHFDHPADFSRLLNGKGFRRSQMAQDLARWKAAQS